MKSAIIVDSTAYLREDLLKHSDIYVVNLTVNFSDGSEMVDTSDVDKQRAFYERLQQEKQLPTTSQPKPGEYYELMDRLIAEGYETVYCIHLSSAISGTYQTAQMIAQEYQDRVNIYCVDSKATAIVMESMVNQTLADIQAQLEPSVIHERLLWQAVHSHIYLMVEDLNNLVKGGRLSATGALLGGILKIRPLLHIDDEGQVVLFEKIRTSKKVYRRWSELITQALEQYPQGVKVSFAHGDALEEILEVQKELAQEFPQVSFDAFGLGPVIGTHTGKGIKGMAIIPLLP